MEHVEYLEIPRRRGRPPNSERASRFIAVEPSGESVAPRRPVRRLTVSDVDDWLLGRLNAQWPGSDARTWIGKFNSFGMSNDILAITNEEAVAVFFTIGHLMTGKPMVMEAFLFSRAAKQNTEGDLVVLPGSPEEASAYDLYTYAFNWAKLRGAVRTICGACSDMPHYAIRKRRSCPLLADVR